MSKTKGKKAYTLLGLLDKNTRLVSDRHAFIMQVSQDSKTGPIWVSKYYYSDLGNAIRGYAKYWARKKRRKVIDSKPLLDLINLVANLEQVVLDIGERLSKEWRADKTDLVEQAIEKHLEECVNE